MNARGTVRSFLPALAVACVLLVILPMTDALALKPAADGTWMTNGRVYATARLGSVLYIGGTFTNVSSKAPGTGGTVVKVTNLAAINMNTGRAIAAFHPAVTGNAHQVAQVQSLAIVGDTLYVGGQFAAINGVAHYDIGAVHVDPSTHAGTVDPGFHATVGVPGAANEGAFYTYRILPGGSGLFIGGAFAKVDGTARTNAAELNWNGTLVSSWTVTGVNGPVRDMRFAQGAATIFVAGAFSMFDGAPGQSIVRVSAATGARDAWAIPAGGVVVGDASDPGMTCWSLAVSATRLFAGCGRGPNYVAAFHLDDGTVGTRAWLFRTVGNVQAVALTSDGGRLIFGGHFGTFFKQKVCGKKHLKNLGILKSINTDTPALNCKFLPNFEGPNPFGGVWEIQVTPAFLWVGGEFATIGGVRHQGLARFTF